MFFAPNKVKRKAKLGATYRRRVRMEKDKKIVHNYSGDPPSQYFHYGKK